MTALETPTASNTAIWTQVCSVDDLWIDRGSAALVGTQQIALFRCSDGEIYAVGHRDPFTGANVMARGLVGSRGGVPTVASPLHKQTFDLRTGECLDDPSNSLRVWPVQIRDGRVWVLATSSAG
ncbi:nitrite reductase (NADH) small subunit [Branchiibius hedensis]|uniref:Nitrite reductase (NADH) small subunit n=1 Tax=Branchiibius hedensis TaxID=672460 RepID=A0A2Y8ZN99_9MICO|nr:nitrite reductase small subunit NirD [Branchiibius hedensis]PWJ24975.1 nitrite reductase (NADH) small subunit [Branchiibius hedensis]SSA33790.1 nitrite reductase (NADH) small subunit [Branchiibius hedensis]